jgi:hypothetical protein
VSEEHESRLQAMLDDKRNLTWDHSPNDKKAIQWSVDSIRKLREERRDLLRIIHAIVMANGGELEVDFDRITIAGAWDTKLEFYNDPKYRCVLIREVKS